MNEQDISALLKRVETLEKNNAVLESKFTELEQTVDTINRFMAAITESQSIETTMNEIECVAKQLTSCDNATFYCFDNTQGKFFSSGDNREWQSREMSSELKNTFDSQKIKSSRNEAVIPLVNNKGNSMGVIALQKTAGFTERDFDNFSKGSQIVSTVELAMQKEFEHQGRVTDELTSLKNRQGLNEYLANTVCGNVNEGRNVSILMCDIDRFKSINDTYGHDAGDVILKGVSEILSESTRNGADCAFRMGGEEMVCILNCSPEKAVDIAERLRAQIENTVHHVSDKGQEYDVKVTVSIGIAEMKPQEEMNRENARRIFDSEFKKADNAVYEAKETGRNKIVCADSDVFKSYITRRTAELLCTDCAEKASVLENKISEYLNSGKGDGVSTVIEALQNFAEKNFQMLPETDSLIAHIERAYGGTEERLQEADHTPRSADKEVKYFNKNAYSKIQNKEYINVPAGIAYKISQRAQAADILHSVKYAGDKSTVTVDGVKDKAFINEMKKEFAEAETVRRISAEKPLTYAYDSAPEDYSYLDPPPDLPPMTHAYETASEEFPVSDILLQPQKEAAPAKKSPTFFNKDGYRNIDNKTYIGTDSKTAFAISKSAKENGIEHSVKYDGQRSAVTVDGKKDRGFIETVKAMSEWADKVQIKAAKIRDQEHSRSSGAR